MQSVVLGMGLALAFMFGGAFGLFLPVVGALIQELIDVASILNALRALGGGGRPSASRETTDVAERFRAEHREFAPELMRVRSVADRLGQLPQDEVRRELEAVRRFVVECLRSTRKRRRPRSTPWSRAFRQLVDDLPQEGPTSDDLVDLRRVLYGLHAILRLHFAQEDEAYAWLSSGEEPVPVS
jgi:hypothetical protein